LRQFIKAFQTPKTLMLQSKTLDKNLNKKISYMRVALNLAKKGLGHVYPNP